MCSALNDVISAESNGVWRFSAFWLRSSLIDPNGCNERGCSFADHGGAAEEYSSFTSEDGCNC